MSQVLYMTHTNDLPQIISRWSGLLTGSVCYLPVLGPVYTGNNSVEQVLSDVLSGLADGEFLFYDKNKRWYTSPPERVLVADIVVVPGGIFIPAKNSFRKNTLKIFYYSSRAVDDTDVEKAREIWEALRRREDFEKCTLYSFLPPAMRGFSVQHNLYLQRISEGDLLSESPPEICLFCDLVEETKKTFAFLGQEPEMNGFDFLWRENILKNKSLSPIICLVRNSEIIGAIGPLDVWPDAWGGLQLLPPYFGVKEKFRGKDCGARLWRAALDFAARHGAKYTLVQNVVDSQAARFYEAQGLERVGEIYTMQL